MSLTGFWIQGEAIVVVAVYYLVTHYVVRGFCVFINSLRTREDQIGIIIKILLRDVSYNVLFSLYNTI